MKQYPIIECMTEQVAMETAAMIGGSYVCLGEDMLFPYMVIGSKDQQQQFHEHSLEENAVEIN